MDFKFGRDNNDFSLKIRRTRRLRAGWTPELAQDIQAFHNIDAESELVRLLTEEITRQVDREIINELINKDKFEFKFGR
jgi:hypothetical protein